MSTHVFDDLKIRESINMQGAGSILSTGQNLTLVADNNQSINLIMTGAGNVKLSRSSLSKSVYMGNKILTTSSNSGSIDLFSLNLSQNSQGGIKIYVITQEAVSKASRFDEFMSIIHYNSQPSFFQLGSSSDNSAILTNTTRSTLSISSSGTVSTNNTFTIPMAFQIQALGNSASNQINLNVSFFAEWYGDSATSMV